MAQFILRDVHYALGYPPLLDHVNQTVEPGTYDVNMVPRAVKVIKQMVENGEVTKERIQQSANRVRNCR